MKYTTELSLESLKRIQQGVKENKVFSNVAKLVIGEVETIQTRDKSKQVTSAEILSVIKKLIKSNEEVLSYGDNQTLVDENVFLNRFIPEELDDETITNMIKIYIDNGANNIGLIMKNAKSDMGLQFDGKKVKNIASGLL